MRTSGRSSRPLRGPLVVAAALFGAAGCVDAPPQDTAPPADTTPDEVPGDTAPDETGDTQPQDTGEPPDTAPEESPPLTEEDVGSLDAVDDTWLFDPLTIHTIALTISDASASALGTDPYTPVEATVTIDEEPELVVGVRLRGKIGSFRTLSGKPKFEIDFNEFVPRQRFYGLESLSLNNNVVDCSMMKELLGYRVFDLLDVPHPRTGAATVTVNGAPYGLYTLIETPDDRFLRRVYDDPSGNLYDGKYIWYGGYSYTLLDFNSGVDELYQLEEGVDVKWADIHAVSEAIPPRGDGATFVDRMDPVLDWDEYHRELAVEQWIGHNDGYALNRNNYRVYFDPTDGKAEIVPWDLDYAFLRDSDWGMNWGRPAGQLAQRCFREVGCADDHRAYIADLLDAVDAADLVTWFDEVDAATYAAAMADPRQECGAAYVRPYRDALRAYIPAQQTSLRAWWGL